LATTLICGFEMGDVAESTNTTGTISISTSVFRSGARSLRCNPTNNNGRVIFSNRAAGGSQPNIAQSFRFYIRIDSLPSVDVPIASTSSTAAGTQLILKSNGTFSIRCGDATASATSSLALTADSQWHRVDADVNGTTRTLYVDGPTQWAQSTGGTSATPQTSLTLGIDTSATADIYLDDVLLDDSSFGAPPSGANNKAIILIPTAGNNAGSWTDGAGGTGDIHGSVDNIPPVGVAASTAAAKIKNAATGSNLDYVATMQSYSAAGIPAGSIINAVQAICNDGEEAATGTKAGGLWIASNPAQSASTTTFDYGDDGGALGTFPAQWATHFGAVSVNPSVTLSTAPTVTVRKVGSTNRVVDVDFMGLYVDYTPPPIGKLMQVNQAVKRASFF